MLVFLPYGNRGSIHNATNRLAAAVANAAIQARDHSGFGFVLDELASSTLAEGFCTSPSKIASSLSRRSVDNRQVESLSDAAVSNDSSPVPTSHSNP